MTSAHLFSIMAAMPEKKLAMLSRQAGFDLAGACSLDPSRRRGGDGRWLYPATLPDGKSVRMLKVLMDNACQNDCGYCAQRAGRNTRRDRFEPDELARLFDGLARAGLVQALFLSSGLGCNPVRAMDRMLETVEIIRKRYAYRGFVHLKILPAAQPAQVERAAELAQRISINLEVPGASRMRALSSRKDFRSHILERMWWISKQVTRPDTLARGHTTQFVVGAAGESDREIVLATSSLYRDYRLSRAYYSAFQPVDDTPLAHLPPTCFMREHRLYQADFLLRKYGFEESEIPFEADGNLCLHTDPKTRWANAHPELFPLEVNSAEPESLLRVPGLGPLSVKRILVARGQGRIRWLDDIDRLGARSRQAAPFLLFAGHPGRRQLELF